MNPHRIPVILGALLAGAALVAAPAPAGADPIDALVTLDTSALVGHPAGPFSLDFQLNRGDPGTAANSAILSAFDFGGGSASGTPILFGGASGDLASTVLLSDTDAFNTFTQEFIAGASLSFRLQLTTNVEPGLFPDQFSFAILDSSGSELPTLDPFGVILLIDLDSSNPTILTFGSDPTTPPVAGGPPLNIAAPTVTAIPEPASLVMLALGLGGAVVLGPLRPRRARAA